MENRNSKKGDPYRQEVPHHKVSSKKIRICTQNPRLKDRHKFHTESHKPAVYGSSLARESMIEKWSHSIAEMMKSALAHARGGPHM